MLLSGICFDIKIDYNAHKSQNKHEKSKFNYMKRIYQWFIFVNLFKNFEKEYDQYNTNDHSPIAFSKPKNKISQSIVSFSYHSYLAPSKQPI